MPRPAALLAASILAFATGVAVVLAGARWADTHGARRRDPAPDLEVLRRAVVISMDELPDAAVAVFDSLTPRIYLNTRLLAQIGPELAAFLRAHEEGHLAYHHVPERRFGLVRVETPVPADCHAARSLRRGRPESVRAAIKFFQQRRTLVTDSAHPSMGSRADRIIDCLTDPAQPIPINQR